MPMVIEGRFRIIAPIGRGAQGETFRAMDEASGELVAVKSVDFADMRGWDRFDAFEREAAVLSGLDHPAIPRVVARLRLEEDGAPRLLLIQEFIEGENLQVLMESGTLFDEPRLTRYAAELLDVLVYLHGHSPPVLHRDIKPANILERGDGRLALVDFGAAQGAGKEDAVIGTSGYMPAEQLMGRAVPASDLYALGATLVHLATSRHPTLLQTADLALDWRRFASLSPEFAAWVDRLVAPFPEDRFPSAVVARAQIFARRRPDRGLELGGSIEELADDIEAQSRSRQLAPYPTNKPQGCEIEIRRAPQRIEVDIPTPPARAAVLWALAVTALLLLAVGSGDVVFLAVVVVAFAVPTAFRMLRDPVCRLTGTEDAFVLHHRREMLTRRLPLNEVAGPEVVPANNGDFRVQLVRREGKPLRVADLKDKAAAQWLCAALHEFLVEHRMRGD